MKKKLEAELISIAHKILQLKNKSDLQVLQEQSRVLYEKLTILNFAETHFEGAQPTIGKVREQLEKNDVVDEVPSDRTVVNEEKAVKEGSSSVKQDIVEDVKDTLSSVEIEPTVDHEPEVTEKQDDIRIEDVKSDEISDKPELIIEEINARVTGDLFVRANEEESYGKALLSDQQYEKNDFEEITGAHQGLPILDKGSKNETKEKPKSLHDQLKKGIHIGLNDRLAFIKHLFDGSSADYNRVLSQLNTYSSKEEAHDFIQTMVKPDHNQWEGKQAHEERFVDLVMSKFE
ncbi:hypothetical protein [Aquimarina intermedia]|uniref:Uncharacterized protein n=1 Tax=Aquimarina intermedia TaxID=350814 RepID=A0A5S5CF83_9FLAO|nr:hypothetical protein [Aquimarina intermedia]TYP77020.1 hypothetical protein BD809_101167 [Aquimarina intermedia]